ncbi:hypothetical protein GEMRC1_006441 [Eukaryota sp. GEM-RC1]
MSSVVAHVSPLAVMNVVDSLTRSCAKSLPHRIPYRSRGLLLGRFDGSSIFLTTAFPIISNESDPPSFEMNYAKQRTQQYLEVFKTDYIIGTYTCGYDTVDLSKEAFLCRSTLKSLAEVVPDILPSSGIVLEHTPTPSTSIEAPIVQIYDVSTDVFSSVSVTITSSDPERVCLETLQQTSTEEDSRSSVTSTLSDSLAVFARKLEVIADYIDEVANGSREADPEILKILNSIHSSISSTISIDQVSDSIKKSSIHGTFLLTLTTKLQALISEIEIPSIRDTEPELYGKRFRHRMYM